MSQRSQLLQDFLTSMYAAIVEQPNINSEAVLTAERIFGALETPMGATRLPPSKLPICELLPTVARELSRKIQPGADSASAPSKAVAHAQALAALSARLRWYRRQGADRIGEPFISGHANATVIGEGGLEEHDGIWIGVSLMAPGITYPEHRHPPEEVYVVLSPGEWQQSGGAWHKPGVGGIVYNPPDILHAMRSGSAPLLASWCLWSAT
ncbi:MAG: dimethylsulfonioproprionate lyase family protein [Granulosicoccus sp.]